MVIIWWWRGIIRMYFSKRILWSRSIINNGKYIFVNSFPNNIKRFNKICLVCSCHIMNKTMNLLPNLMKHLHNSITNLMSLWNIIIYFIYINYIRVFFQKEKWFWCPSIIKWLPSKGLSTWSLFIALWCIDAWSWHPQHLQKVRHQEVFLSSH